MAAIIIKKGKHMCATMECGTCGCEFKVTLKECTRDIIMGVKFYNCDCPCCGDECSCTKEAIVECEKD